MKSASTFESHWLKQVHDQAYKIDPSLHGWHQDALGKLDRLHTLLLEYGSVLIAYSGGVDSTFLLKVAVHTLGPKAIGLIAISESYPEWEHEQARIYAQEMGLERLVEVQTHEMQRPGYRANAGDRCYHCKAELFDVAHVFAQHNSEDQVLCYGAIMDDLGDHRPGMQAAKEREAQAPLIEAKLYKKEIRYLSRLLQLPTWDKPASACLSSRFPYGMEITSDRLAQVGRCEARLMALGFQVFRARYHGDLVRLEFGQAELDQLYKNPMLRDQVSQACKEIGFKFISIDLDGYRSGSANEALVSIEGL
jgi:uncharacterized protein